MHIFCTEHCPKLKSSPPVSPHVEELHKAEQSHFKNPVYDSSPESSIELYSIDSDLISLKPSDSSIMETSQNNPDDTGVKARRVQPPRRCKKS